MRRNIQPVQFAPGGTRPCSEHAYPDRWCRETLYHTRGELLAEIFGLRAVLMRQRHGKLGDEWMETGRVRQRNSVNIVAFSIDLFLRSVQAIVVRKNHYGCLLYFMIKLLATLPRIMSTQSKNVLFLPKLKCPVLRYCLTLHSCFGHCPCGRLPWMRHWLLTHPYGSRFP